VETLRSGGPNPIVLDPLDGAKPYLITALWRDLGRPVLWLLPGPEDARAAYDQVTPYLPTMPDGDTEHPPAFLFPEPDSLPFERLASDATTTRDRIRALAALAEFRTASATSPLAQNVHVKDGIQGAILPQLAPLIIASGHAAIQTTLPPRVMDDAIHTLRVGGHLAIDELARRWIDLGYEAVPAVEFPGSFSRRGGIIDIWSPGSDFPARIELFGSEIESLRLFDAGTQRSVSGVESYSIAAARELLPSAMPSGPVEVDRASMDAHDPSGFLEDLARLTEGELFPGAEFFSPMFQRTTLLDHLPTETVVIMDRPARLRAALDELALRGEEIRRGQAERGVLPSDFPSPLAPADSFQRTINDIPRRLHLDPFSAGARSTPDDTTPRFGTLGFTAPDSYGGQISRVAKDIRQARDAGQAVVVASLQAQRLAELLEAEGHELSLRDDIDVVPTPGTLTIVRQGVTEGWSLGKGSDEGPIDGITLLTDADVFGIIKRSRAVRKRPVRRDSFLSDLSTGDYVVHVEHGIGRFDGTESRVLDGSEREYLILGYAQGDRLYVPTDQIDRIARYVGPGGAPTLTRLGGTDWTSTKRKAKEAALEFARELVALYAARELEQGSALSSDTPWQWELETSFPFQETPDQMLAITEVKRDLESQTPMDRLICGDVGYGKTEVALRAAFKAVQNGGQVVVLVPTTILAQQHFTNFRDRLEPFPVRVEMLSRLRSNAQQRETVKAMREGDVDIVIGTHRLLSSDIGFKNLGLVIIDEEQRFGVKHKEGLKQMRAGVDVLTMTATPIPRTLHMALLGIRDMSRIETAPEERIPVMTYVAESDDRQIREAVLREMDRGGQVFFVHNRILDIEHVHKQLRELIPEASFAIAHGRMPAEGLEHVMESFADGTFDVLLCTTIIQAGLDIPNANTLIVDEADKLGLTQLYQLRGRVGRSSVRAYAYFLFKRDRVLTQTAEKRLRAILSATELGAGFRIAMKDLEIRGAGNVLGAQQSGHVAAVGFDLYTRLLTEAVEELRQTNAKPVVAGNSERRPLRAPPAPRPPVDLPVDARIPTDYIADTATRLAVYEKLAETTDPDQVGMFRSELEDRFGTIPQPVDDLLFVVLLRCRAARLMGAIRSVTTEGAGITVRFRDMSWLNRDSLRRSVRGLDVGNLQAKIRTAQRGDHWRDDLLLLLDALAQQSALSAPALARS
jgi:transcription-repair coupling factor (superfamily II helicase)